MIERGKPSKNLRELIDQIDGIREELLAIQRSLEKTGAIESAKSRGAGNGNPKQLWRIDLTMIWVRGARLTAIKTGSAPFILKSKLQGCLG